MKNQTTIPDNIFKRLMQAAKCDSGDGLDLVGMSAKYQNYEIGFFGRREDDYHIKTDNFGFTQGGKWRQVLPTKEQLEAMQKAIDGRVKDMQPQAVQDDFNGNYYDQYGVRPQTFFSL